MQRDGRKVVGTLLVQVFQKKTNQGYPDPKQKPANMMLLALFIACLIGSSVSAIVNEEISRVIDGSGSIVQVSLTIKASGLSGSYSLMFPDSAARNLAFLEVKEKNEVYSVAEPQTDGSNSVYDVRTGDKSSVTLKVKAIFTELLEMYPAEITQMEDQRVRLSDNHYVLTPYMTETQKTTVRLASTQVESWTRLEPNVQRGSSVTYGPYKNIPGMASSPMSVHYVNNKPFAKLVQAEREVEVSHWGNIAVEETYELRHVGASLKGGFSRLDYQMSRDGDRPSFASLMAYLPREARDIYYRDQIGNISTSDITVTDEDLQMEVGTRFPLFGGWKTEFYIGYSVPAGLALFVGEDNTYSLEFDYFTIFQDVWIENMEIKVVLPEGCTDINVQLPYEVTEQFDSRRFTYLDSTLTGGRPVVTIRARNVVEHHSDQVIITYKFSGTRMIVEPMMVMGCIFACFVVLTLVNAASAIGYPAKAKQS